MNVKHLFSLAALTFVLAACGGGDDDPVNPTPKQEETPTITIDSSVTSNGLAFTNEAGEKSITFTVSEAWTLSVAATRSGSSWCTPSLTNGAAGTVTIMFTVTANDSYDDRSVSVTIKCGTVTKTFTITQKAVDALLVTTDKYEVGQEGGTIEVEVKANIDYQMEIAASAKGWITQASTRGLVEKSIKLTIAENTADDSRTGTVTFFANGLSETVTITQEGKASEAFELTVPEAGWLKDKDLGRYNSIKLIGNLNGDDIITIRNWARTERNLLDLSEAHIVSGGGAYYNDFYETKDNVISSCMFCLNGNGNNNQGCKFTKVLLPTDVTSIEKCAFFYCSNLTTIDIPDGVTTIEGWAFGYCSSLTNITIPNGVTSIGDAFEGCSSLTSIKIL